jgi:flagellar hook assembly protein FlgD
MFKRNLRTRRLVTSALVSLAAAAVLAASAFALTANLAFSPAVNIPAGALHTTFIATGDLNGDGNLDLVAVNYTGGNASVFLGNGLGGFSAPVLYDTGATPKACMLKDMNGNGTLDLVTADDVPNAVAVLQGDGHGGFSAPVLYPVGASSQEITVTDLNNDGRLDIVSVNDLNPGYVSILLATSGGGYQLKGPIDAGPNTRDVAAADFNRDGNMDVVVAFEGDTVDAIPGGVEVWQGNGKGGLTRGRQMTAGTTPKAIDVGDYNNDGKADFVVSSEGTNDVRLFLGDGTGRFTRSATVVVGVMPKYVFPADVNGDGNLDAIATDYMDANVAVLLGDGAGHLAAAKYMTVGKGPKSVTVGDFNKDGMPDLATANNDVSTVSVLLSVLTAPTITGLNASLAAFSPNADGYQDKTTITYTTNQSLFNTVAVYNSGGTFMKSLKSNAVLAADLQTMTWDGKYTPAGGTSTVVPDGTYTVRVTGKDAIGNAVQSSIPVTVDTTISKITINYTRFSPNGDGGRDTTTIGYTLKNGATTTVLVRDGSGATVRTIQNSVAQVAGTYTAVWDGKLTDGTVAPEGAYTAVVQAVDGVGTIESIKAVTIDLTSPGVTGAMVTPSPFVPPATTTISFAIDEPGSVSVKIYNSAKTLVATLTKTLATGANSIVWDGTTTSRSIAAPGTYTVKLSVKDTAYNKASPYPIVLTVDIGV